MFRGEPFCNQGPAGPVPEPSLWQFSRTASTLWTMAAICVLYPSSCIGPDISSRLGRRQIADCEDLSLLIAIRWSLKFDPSKRPRPVKKSIPKDLVLCHLRSLQSSGECRLNTSWVRFIRHPSSRFHVLHGTRYRMRHLCMHKFQRVLRACFQGFETEFADATLDPSL